MNNLWHLSIYIFCFNLKIKTSSKTRPLSLESIRQPSEKTETLVRNVSAIYEDI